MSPTEASSLVLSVAVGGVTVLLWFWQRLDRKRRGAVVSPEDVIHFRRQDQRRAIVTAIMAILSVGIFAGSRMETRVGDRPNLLFVEIWVAIFCLILILLVLAMLDWVATRRFAIRQRSTIMNEGIEILKAEIRARAAVEAASRDLESRNGHPTLPSS